MGQFIFGDFILSGETLLRGDEIIALPPKERKVLRVLLEAAGEMISKDELLERVWGGGEEGSLTRSIYVLRGVLDESRENRYIQSVYGRGYRIVKPITRVYDRSELPSVCCIAVLPFELGAQACVSTVHSQIVDSLSTLRFQGVNVRPVFLTRQSSIAEIEELVSDAGSDYYLTGCCRIVRGVSVLCVELVRADHVVVFTCNASFAEDDWLQSLKDRLVLMLPRCIPGLSTAKETPRNFSLAATLSFMRAKHSVQNLTLRGLLRGLSQFHSVLALDGAHVLSWCALAECYLIMMLIGEMPVMNAMVQIRIAMESAWAFEPCSSHVLKLKEFAATFWGRVRDADVYSAAVSLGLGLLSMHDFYASHFAAENSKGISLDAGSSLALAHVLDVCAVYLREGKYEGIKRCTELQHSSLNGNAAAEGGLLFDCLKAGMQRIQKKLQWDGNVAGRLLFCGQFLELVEFVKARGLYEPEAKLMIRGQ